MNEKNVADWLTRKFQRSLPKIARSNPAMIAAVVESHLSKPLAIFGMKSARQYAKVHTWARVLKIFNEELE